MQIYCDFSGYSDMALGSAHLLGYELTLNFNMPYLRRHRREFWRRWHISLSTWLRDYLFIPLGGSRGGRWQTYRNLMITMPLGGLWHGAGWTFVVWGVLHGADPDRPPRLPRLQRSSGGRLGAVGVGRTASGSRRSLACVGWVFFRRGDVRVGPRRMVVSLPERKLQVAQQRPFFYTIIVVG